MTLLAAEGLSVEVRDGHVVLSLRSSPRSQWATLRLTWNTAQLLSEAIKLAAQLAADEEFAAAGLPEEVAAE